MNNSDTTIHVYQNWTIKWMDGGRWDPGFLLLESEVIDKQVEEAGMIHVVTD